MNSQQKWGIGFCAAGAVISYLSFAYDALWGLIYGIPLLLIGLALILLPERERKIEEVMV